MKKRIYTSLLIATVIILGACVESGASADLSNYPQSVQNKDIGVEFYDQSLEFYDEYSVVYDNILFLRDAEKRKSDIILSSSYKDLIEVTIKGSEELIENTSLTPDTEYEIVISKIIEKILSLQNDYNTELQHKKENNLSEHETSIEDIITSIDILYKEFEHIIK